MREREREKERETDFVVYMSSLEHRDSRNHTSLSRKVWEIRDSGHTPKVTFSIHKESKSAGTCDRSCRLCLDEKKCILYEPNQHILNSHEEIFSKCRHKTRWKLEKLISDI